MGAKPRYQQKSLRRALSFIVICLGILIALTACSGASSSRPNLSQKTSSLNVEPTATATLSPVPCVRAPTETISPTLSPTPLPTSEPLFDTHRITTLGAGFITYTATSPDGRLVIIGYGDRRVQWLDARTGQEAGEVTVGRRNTPYFYFDGVLLSVLFSPDNRLMALITYETITVVDLEQNQAIATTEAETNDGLSDVVFSNNGKSLVFKETSRSTGESYSQITTFSVSENRRLNVLPVTDVYGSFNVSAPAVSPDSRLVAAGSYDNRIFLWSLETGQLLRTLRGHAAGVNRVAFRPDGQALASASIDGTVRLWDLRDGSLMRVITGFLQPPFAVRFIDSQHLLVTFESAPSQLVNVETGEMQEQAQKPTVQPLHPLVFERYLAGYFHSRWGSAQPLFSPDGKTVAMLSDILQLWDWRSRRVTTVIAGGEGEAVAKAAFNPDGSQIAVGFRDGRIGLWDTTSGAILREVRSSIMQDEYVYQLLFSPNSQYLAASFRTRIEIFDATTARQIDMFTNENLDGYSLKMTFSPDSRSLYALGNGGRDLMVWNMAGGRLVRQEEMPNGYEHGGTQRGPDWHWPWFARFSDDPDGYHIELRNVETGALKRIDYSGSGGALTFNPDGSLLIGQTYDGLFIWKTASFELAYFRKSLNPSESIAFSPDTHILAVGGTGELELWDFQPILERASAANFGPVPTPTERSSSYDISAGTSIPARTPVPTLALPPLPTPALGEKAISAQNAEQIREAARFGDGFINWAGWSPDGSQIIVIGSQDVSFYDPSKPGSPLVSRRPRPIQSTGFEISGAVFDTRGSLIASGTTQERVQAWNLTRGSRLVDRKGSGEEKLSPDGRLLVYEDGDEGLSVYDIQARKTVSHLSGNLNNLAWSPDSQSIASGGYYGDVRVWDAQSGAIINALYTGGDEVRSLSFSPDGHKLVAAAGHNVYRWENSPGATPKVIPIRKVGTNPQQVLTPLVVSFSEDGRLAVGTQEGLIQVLDLTARNVIQQLDEHVGAVRFLAFHLDGQRLLSVTTNAQVSVWDLSLDAPIEQVLTAQYSSRINGLVFDPEDHLYAWGDNLVWKIQPQDGSLFDRTYIPEGRIFSVARDGTQAAVNRGLHMQLWDLPTGALRLEMAEEPEEVYAHYTTDQHFSDAEFSRDGRLLGVAGTGGVWIYDAQTGDLLEHVETYDSSNWIDLHPSNRFYLTDSAYDFHFAGIYLIQAGLETTDLLEANIQLTMVVPPSWYSGKGLFTPDGQRVVRVLYSNYGTQPDQLAVWNAATGKLIDRIDLIPGAKTASLVIDPSGRLAAVGMDDGHILLVDLNTDRILVQLRGHIGKVSALAFSQDGSYLASAGEEAIIKTWKIGT